MRKLHLQSAFSSRGTLAEDLQDQPGAIDHFRADLLFQVLLLHRVQRRVDDQQVRVLAFAASAISSTCPLPSKVAGRIDRTLNAFAATTSIPIASARPSASSIRASAERRAPSRGSSGTAMSARSPRETSVAPWPSYSFRTAPPDLRHSAQPRDRVHAPVATLKVHVCRRAEFDRRARAPR